MFRKKSRSQKIESVSPDSVEVPTNSQDGISAAVVAAITASICVITGRSSEEFKFTAIRRSTSMQPVWALTGTRDIILTRQSFIERGNR